MRITKNKIINLILNSSFGVLTIFALTKTTIASAAGYIPLEPLTVAEKSGVSISTYLNDIFRIGIGLAGVFAVLMIVIGGIGYIAGASNPSARSEARKKITNAIFGLILASASWLILYTINPKLLNTELLVKKVNNNITQRNVGVQSTEDTGGYCLDGNLSADKPSVRACGMTQQECNERQALWQKNGFIIAKSCYPYQSKAENTLVPKNTSCKVC